MRLTTSSRAGCGPDRYTTDHSASVAADFDNPAESNRTIECANPRLSAYSYIVSPSEFVADKFAPKRTNRATSSSVGGRPRLTKADQSARVATSFGTAVGVAVEVGTGVGVLVGVWVALGSRVGVDVILGAGVDEGVGIAVGVDVAVGIGTGVGKGVGRGVAVTKVILGVGLGVAVT